MRGYHAGTHPLEQIVIACQINCSSMQGSRVNVPMTLQEVEWRLVSRQLVTDTDDDWTMPCRAVGSRRPGRHWSRQTWTRLRRVGSSAQALLVARPNSMIKLCRTTRSIAAAVAKGSMKI